MNDTDSKKLEGIQKRGWHITDIVNGTWLISKVKEQDRKIAELRARLPGTDAPWTLKELDDAKARIAEQDREIERHLDRSVQLMAEKHYQRRHRKWALEEARTNLHDLWWVQESQTHKDKQRAEKAEAELSACKERVRELEEKLFKYGEMKKAPCFVCGYNGQNYYSPSVHPCAERHHRLQALQAQEQSKEVEG